jgi:hypothetical protein
MSTIVGGSSSYKAIFWSVGTRNLHRNERPVHLRL